MTAILRALCLLLPPFVLLVVLIDSDRQFGGTVLAWSMVFTVHGGSVVLEWQRWRRRVVTR
jgi:hypothetical protein